MTTEADGDFRVEPLFAALGGTQIREEIVAIFDDDVGDRLDEVRARFEHLAGADPDFTVIENSGLTDFVDGPDAETKAGPAGDRGSADGNDMCNFHHGIIRVRSEERRVGKECVSTFRSGWTRDH